MEVFPTSKICDLPKLILEWNCIHFRDETGKKYKYSIFKVESITHLLDKIEKENDD